MSEFALAMIGRCTVGVAAVLGALALLMVPFLMHEIDEAKKEMDSQSGRIFSLFAKLDKLNERVEELEER